MSECGLVEVYSGLGFSWGHTQKFLQNSGSEQETHTFTLSTFPLKPAEDHYLFSRNEMSHRVVTTTSTTTTTSASDGGCLNIGYCRSVSGLLKVAQMVRKCLYYCTNDLHGRMSARMQKIPALLKVYQSCSHKLLPSVFNLFVFS